MAKMSEAAVPSLLFTETDDASIATPAAGKASLFRDTDNGWKSKDEAGTVASIGGVGAVLYDSTVTGADALIIDTGAAGISGSYNVIEVWLYLRTDEAAALSAVDVRVNNDSSALYDRNFTATTDTTVSGGNSLAQTAWTFNAAGASAAANVFAVYRLAIPCYATTGGFKMGEVTGGVLHTTAASTQVSARMFQYRATTAISRMSVAPNTALKKLVIGSRMIIFGR